MILKRLNIFRLQDLKQLFIESFRGWNRHNIPRLGAALAFYSLLSLAPFMLLVVSIGGLAFGRKAVESQLIWQIGTLVGPPGRAGIEALLEGTQNTAHGILATGLAILTLFFGASGVLIELQDALNGIWEVAPVHVTGMRNIARLLRERLFSFALILAIGFLSVASLVMNALLAGLGAYLHGLLPTSVATLHLAVTAFSFLAAMVLFGAIYKVVPDVHLRWRDVAEGALFTATLFTVGKFLISWYLGNASFASTYGAAASVVILILWIYYSAQIFFFGAEFTRVLRTSGSRIMAPPALRSGLTASTCKEPYSGSKLAASMRNGVRAGLAFLSTHRLFSSTRSGSG
jgi:membrane protein